jgi:hypothetical protein
VNNLSITLQQLERLESLHVTLKEAEAYIPLIPPRKQKVCSVRDMKIGFSFVVEDQNSDLLTIVGRILRRMVEYVQKITIYTYGLRYIRMLSLDDDESQLKGLRLPSSLDYLNLSGSQALLHMFGSNTVTNFEFRDRGSLMLKASRLSAWSNLRFLNLTSIDSSFHHFSSPTLQVLSIHLPRNTATGTALCQQLAIHGDRCPSLERLEFSECPEWDIFMIMLERRNCKPDSAVIPIQYIVLPARVPRIIRSAVRERIQGRRSPRPSNYELSLQGNIDILCDSDL